MKLSASVISKVVCKVLAAIILFANLALQAKDTILVGADAEWRYYNLQTPPPENWKAPAFNAETWKSGQAQLGYGDGDEITVIDGGALTPHPVSAYFRRSFTTDTPSIFTKLLVRLIRDDGAVVYLNGVEVVRSNMPDGAITPDTLAVAAVGADAENTFFTYEVPTSALVAGQNVIAVEVHQVNVSSTDVSFALQLIAASEDSPALPTVSIVASQADTSESDPTTRYAPGQFSIRRSGPLDSELKVFIRYDGTAVSGTDYTTLPNEIVFAAGQELRELSVEPHDDFVKEPTETVVAKLSGPPGDLALITYNIDPEHPSATVSIHDSKSGIEIKEPATGATFKVGTTIRITAEALALGGTIPRVSFFDGETLIGTSEPVFISDPTWDPSFTEPTPGEPITHTIEWQNASVGEHVLTARGVAAPQLGGALGPLYISQKVVIHVVNETDGPPIKITQPAAGDSFAVGQTIEIKAVAVSPAGTSQRVEFFSDGILIGVSTVPLDQIEPGRMTHRVFWTGAAAGDHVLTARLTVSGGVPPTVPQVFTSYPVKIHVGPVVPVLSIEATYPVTSEPLPNALVTPGLFTIRRSGPTDPAFTAWVFIGGTATSGIDYEAVPTQIQFASGQTEAEIKILPKSDDLVEGDETVVAELTQPPTAGAVLIYTINPDKRRAVVTIKDEDSPKQARIEITSPKNGAIIDVGTTIVVNATAVDPEGYIPRVEFFSDGVSIGVSEINFIVAPEPGTPIYHSIEWKNVPAGVHVLTARGVSANGVVVVSQEVKIYVIAIDPPPPNVVSIRKVEDPTLRPIPNADYASDFFEIRRTGLIDMALQVYFRVPQDGEHIATPDVDYHALKSPVTIPAGEFTAYIKVEAIDDTLVEGPEIVRVVLTPVPPNIELAVNANYIIDPDHASADVTILDNDQPSDQVTLAVEVVDGIASEVTVTDAFDTALFVIKRVSGPLDIDVTAQYEMSGTAQNGVDYEKLTGTVLLRAGQLRAGVEITAIPDNLEEGEETVILTLVPPVCIATAPPPPDCYLIGESKTGRAVILDRRDDVPGVKILHPLNGQVFNFGDVIEIEAQAWDREGIISKLEILADGQSLGETNKDHIVVRWTDAAVGEHSLVARAVDGSGQTARTEIHILVREQNADAFVFRRLPDAYTPGTAFTVELRAEPPSGAHAYAVEDHPPTGWAVSEISHEGVFDPATGKVKFGPFIDTTARTLTYRVTPPASATGRKEFSGIGSIDGVDYRIGGDRIIEQSPTEHPADTDKNFAIVVSELTAYAAAWKRGEPIPLSYVTRAGYIWQHGEAYRFDGSQEPPFCWVPLQNPEPRLLAAAGVVETLRMNSTEAQPGVGTTIEIRIAPPAGTSAYAVEERVPVGWNVSNISDEGAFDAATGTIRWGLFFDANVRTVSYTLTAPPEVTAVARFGGRVAFDGAVSEIYGPGSLTSTDGTKLPLLEKCETDASGNVRLELSGAAGQVGVLQSSSDLIHWQDVTTIYLPDGKVQFDDNAGASASRYYRLQVR